MEELKKAFEEMKKVIMVNNEKLEHIENRLARLEKMDSIEHRVAVNQIDLSDIKDVLEDIKDNYTFNGNDEFKSIHKRLDSHLIRIARVEEDLIILKEKDKEK
jgi:DNA-binding TFAR19-related protein (PDSD5 family)